MNGLRVVVKCPDCVDVRMPPEDVTIRLCVDDECWSYRFACPGCGLPANSPTSEQAASAALDAGCPLERWRLPAELLERHDGPPLTIADLSELHQLLLRVDWFDALSS